MLRSLLALGVLSLLVAGAQAHDEVDEFAGVTIETTPLHGGMFMLSGAGGNMLAGTGVDGALLVDDQFAPLHQRIRDALKAIGAEPLRFIINTHWHGDHTGGNEDFAKEGVVILAQDNVRRRMSAEQVIEALKQTVPPSPQSALPVITFSDEATLHLNGDSAHAIHIEHAHTDGDSLVWFEKANVLHMGDIFFNQMYPLIDLSTGGGINGVIAGGERGLALANDETQIIPGHGPLATKADLAAYVAMLRDVRDRVATLKAAGKSRDEVVAARPTAAYDERLGHGFISPDQLVSFVFDSL